MEQDFANPYYPPADLTHDHSLARRFVFAFASSLPVTLIGSWLTMRIGMETTSVAITLFPSAVSLGVSILLLIAISKLPHPIQSGSVLLIGAILSIASLALYLDSVGSAWRGSLFTKPAFASILGALVFVTSAYLSRVRPRSKAAFAYAFLIFATAAFAGLAVFQFSVMSPYLPHIVFVCSACFQAVVVGAIALLIAAGTSKNSSASDACTV